MLFDDDFFIRPLMTADFKRKGYVTETVKEDNITYLYCTDKKTGGKVSLRFMKKGDLFEVDYSIDVKNAFLRDESIGSFKDHITKSYKIISKYKRNMRKTENYPAYPVDYQLFDKILQRSQKFLYRNRGKIYTDL